MKRTYYKPYITIEGGTCDGKMFPIRDDNYQPIEFKSKSDAIESAKKYIRDFKKTPRNSVTFEFVTGYLIRKVTIEDERFNVEKVRAEGKTATFYAF